MLILLPALTSFPLCLCLLVYASLLMQIVYIYVQKSVRKKCFTVHFLLHRTRNSEWTQQKLPDLCCFVCLRLVSRVRFEHLIFYAIVLCLEDGDVFFALCKALSMLPSGSAGEVNYIQLFFQQQFQGIYISGWKAAVVRPSYPDLLNIFCVRHVSWKECCLLMIISSALQPPSHNRTTFLPLQGLIFTSESKKVGFNFFSRSISVFRWFFPSKYTRAHTQRGQNLWFSRRLVRYSCD